MSNLNLNSIGFFLCRHNFINCFKSVRINGPSIVPGAAPSCDDVLVFPNITDPDKKHTFGNQIHTTGYGLNRIYKGDNCSFEGDIKVADGSCVSTKVLALLLINDNNNERLVMICKWKKISLRYRCGQGFMRLKRAKRLWPIVMVRKFMH